jgi:hypothetical protein
MRMILWFKTVSFLSMAFVVILAGANFGPQSLTRSANPWQTIDPAQLTTPWPRTLDSAAGSYWRLDFAAWQARLHYAPSQRVHSPVDPLLISMPLPDGSLARFWVKSGALLLNAPTSDVTSFSGWGVDDGDALVSGGFSPSGVQAIIQIDGRTYHLQPLFQGDPEIYISYEDS